jgi:hypothetical protein
MLGCSSRRQRLRLALEPGERGRLEAILGRQIKTDQPCRRLGRLSPGDHAAMTARWRHTFSVLK